MIKKHIHSPRGFTLFIALIMASVILAVGLSLLNVSYKQVLLASTSKNSTLAFYNADGAVECALYWDAQTAFGYQTTLPTATTIKCDGSTITLGTTDTTNSGFFIVPFSIPCPSVPGANLANVKVYKYANGKTSIYADGYDSCNANDPTRTERGEKATYGG